MKKCCSQLIKEEKAAVLGKELLHLLTGLNAFAEENEWLRLIYTIKTLLPKVGYRRAHPHALLNIVHDILDVLNAYRDPHHFRCNTQIDFLMWQHWFMRGRPRMHSRCFCIAVSINKVSL